MRGALALRQARADAKAKEALRKETFEVARLAVLAKQQAARLRASQGQPSAGDEALLEKIPPKIDNAPKFHLADVRLPARAVDKCRVCDAGIPTEGWCFHCTNLGIGLHESHWETMIAAKPADEPAAEEADTSTGAPAAHLLPSIV